MSRKEVCSYIEMNRGMNIIGSFNRMMTNVSLRLSRWLSLFLWSEVKVQITDDALLCSDGVGYEYGIASRSRYFTDIGCKYGVPGLSLVLTASGTNGRMAELFCINGLD